MNRLKTAGLAGLLALLVAACSSNGGGSASPTPTASPTLVPTAGPSGGASSSGLAIPSIDLNGDPALAATLPKTVGGATLQAFSMRGDVFASAGGTDPSLQKFLDSLGAQLSDVSVAVASGQAGTDTISVAAFRVAGASQDNLEQQFLTSVQEGGDVSGWTTTSLGGKSVHSGTNLGTQGGSLYLYAKGDTLYYVLTSKQALAEDALGQLP